MVHPGIRNNIHVNVRFIESFSPRSTLIWNLFQVEQVGITKIPAEDLKHLGEAISVLTSSSVVQKEKEELRVLKQDRQKLHRDSSLLQREVISNELPSTPSERHKFDETVDRLIEKLEREAENVEREVGDKLHLIHAREDGKIPLQELEHAIEHIKGHPDSLAIKAIVKHIDVDGDGFVSVQEVYRLVQELEDTQEIRVDKGDGTISFLAKQDKIPSTTK
jgi:hypothetical protein